MTRNDDMAAQSTILDFKVTKDFLQNVGGEDAVEVVRICLVNNGKCLDQDIEEEMKTKKITSNDTIECPYTMVVINTAK